MGFLSYVAGGDPEAALRWFAFAARHPETHEGGRALRFQAYLNRRLGRLETAWMLWKDLERRASDPGMRLVAADNLRRIEAELRQRGAPRRGSPPAADGESKGGAGSREPADRGGAP